MNIMESFEYVLKFSLNYTIVQTQQLYTWKNKFLEPSYLICKIRLSNLNTLTLCQALSSEFSDIITITLVLFFFKTFFLYTIYFGHDSSSPTPSRPYPPPNFTFFLLAT